MLLSGSRIVGLFLLLVTGGVMASAHSSELGGSDGQPAPVKTPGKEDRVAGENLVTDQKGRDAAHAQSSQQGGSDQKPTASMMPGNQDRVPGEYLVSVQKSGNEASIRKVFAQYSVRAVQKVSDNLFLLKIEKDPGPDVVKRKGERSNRIRSVQPNFVYRLDPPKGKLEGSVK